MWRFAILVAVGCAGAASTPTPPPRDAAVALTPGAQLFVAAVAAKDWVAAASALERHHVELAGQPYEPAVLAALDEAWDSIVEALAHTTTLTGAYFALARLSDSIPAAHREHLATLGSRAAIEQAELARAARGPGGAWLHARLRARITDDAAARASADAALATAIWPDFDIFPFPRSCNWIAAPARVPGRHVDVATTGLSCQSADERRWDTSDPYGYVEGGATVIGTRTTHHRVIVARITGNVTLRWDRGERDVAVAIDGGVDEIAYETPHGSQPFSMVTAEQAKPEAGRQFHAALTAAVTGAWIEPALAAGRTALSAGDTATAEDQLVIHARLVGKPSAELGTVLARYGLTFGQL